MNYYILISVLVLFVAFICLLYWFQYYKDLNSVVRGRKVRILKPSPLKFNVILVIGLLLFVGSFSMIKVYSLESEKDILMKELEYERFDDGNFPNDLFRLVYEEYNIYFSGYYLDDNNNYILCLTNNVPSELTDILSNGNVIFKKVTYSYAQLKEVYKILSLNIQEYNFFSVALSMTYNRVEVTVIDENVDLSNIQSYIDEGIVFVKIGDAYIAY